MEVPVEAPVAPSLRAWAWKAVLGVLVAGTVVALWASSGDISGAFGALGSAAVLPVAIAVFIEIGAVWALGQVYASAVGTVGARVPSSSAAGVALGASAVSRLVPGGGVTGAWYAMHNLRRLGTRPADATLAVIVVGPVTVVSLITVIAFGAVAAAVSGHAGWSLAIPIAITAGVGLGGLRFVSKRPLRLSPSMQRTLQRIHVDVAGLTAAAQSMTTAMRRSPALLTSLLAWSIVAWALDVLVVHFVFTALGVSVHPGVILLGYGAANLAAALPLTPGGLGFAEAGMAAAYVALGVPETAAVAAVLGYRLIGVWLPALGAAPLALLQISRARSGAADRYDEPEPGSYSPPLGVAPHGVASGVDA